ncbi:MAG TPA: S8 family serine peptidase [Nocardioidaceae bacterium]|nr:S8 family serine peptidase [Nocardioidaceae bacterium]
MFSRLLQLPGAVALVAGSLVLGTAPAPAAVDPARSTVPGIYLVSLAAPPAGAYAGGRAGLPATSPGHGQRFDRTRPAVTRYTRWLLARQDRILHRVGDPGVLYRYTTALDGFAATLTGDQVQDLRATPGVRRVERSTRQHIDRTPADPALASTRSLPGVAGPRGVWARHGGVDRAGAGIVVGVVDSGIWPENPGFSALAETTPPARPGLAGFHGGCAAGAAWSIGDCSDKIVSARWFVRGFGAENTAGAEYLSPRDGSGHGSHVASTAAGDAGVRVVVDGQRFGTVSGLAPAARIAVYKACWTAPDPAEDGCTSADTVAAVDSAVADGVDVLSYSVSGTPVLDDSVESAFLGAAAAGVFVAASAGNAGRAGSVAHVAPWVTTVAASTEHQYSGALRLGDGRSLGGAMVARRRVGPARLVLGSAVAAPQARQAQARRCLTGSLDAVRAEGRIVVCDRGGGPRADKSAAVADAGGVAMVLADTRGQDVDADVHTVPTVHLGARQAAQVRGYLRRTGARATATLVPSAGSSAGAPTVAGFSSRGPADAAGGGVLKPDLTAPGVGVLGAVAPPSDSGRSWDLRSGTSTSAPQVAGLAAFVLGVHPRWSPARVRSAMMTTARDLAGPHGPLVEGAGQVDPVRVLDPGLVFDTGRAAWLRVAVGTEPASQVNAPSVAVGELVGPTTLERRVTNVGRVSESYSVRVRGLRDVDVQAFPATVRLAPGQSRTVRLRITARPSAPVDRDVTGWLVWKGSRHRVRVPVSVRPTVVAAPDEVRGAGTRGSVVVRGRSGNGRTVKLHSSGLVPATSTTVRLRPGPLDVADPHPDAGTSARVVQVPAGSLLARFEVADPRGDLDLDVYRDGRLVGSSTDAAAARVTLEDPAAGAYQVLVNARTAPHGRPATGRLDTWVVPRHTGSALRLSTDAVGFAPGRRFRYSASWAGLARDRRYLGVVSYGDSGRRTLVAVG